VQQRDALGGEPAQRGDAGIVDRQEVAELERQPLLALSAALRELGHVLRSQTTVDADLSESKDVAIPSVEALEFEAALATLTAKFVSLPADAIDAQIEATIGQLADWLGLDRASVAQRDTATGRFVDSQQWNRPGCEPAQYPSVDELPWLLTRLKRGETVGLSGLEELPRKPWTNES
jgi:hypothetical protein